MDFNELWVLIVLAVCCFVANVLHGLTGCGSILVLHALWQTAVTFAPDVLHGTDAFGDENVKSIAHFSYVLTFFIQVVLTGLLFLEEKRTREQQREHGVPPSPSELNGVLLLAFIPCSLIGALVGVYTMPNIQENGSRVILGGSSLFFALTFLSLYQMKYLEKKQTEDVIRDDLMLMRIQSEVQRHVILQYMEDKKRRKARKERRRRHRAHRRAAKKAAKKQRRELLACRMAAASAGAADAPPVPITTASPAEMNTVALMSPQTEYDGRPLELGRELKSPGRAGPLSPMSDASVSSRTGRQLEVHGSSQHASPHATMIGDVHLPDSVTSKDASPFRRHHMQRYWIKEVNVHTYIRDRLAEISRCVNSESEAVARDARVAAWTLRAMDGQEAFISVHTPGTWSYNASRANSASDTSSEGGTGSGGSSGSSDSSDSDDAEGSTTASPMDTATTPSTSNGDGETEPHRVTVAAQVEKEEEETSTVNEPRDPHTRTVRFDTSMDEDSSTLKATPTPQPTAAEREAQHRKWRTLMKSNGGNADGEMDLTTSMAHAAATSSPRRIVMGHAEVLNIGLREAQQQQLKTLQELNVGEYGHSHHQRLVHFIRMDGGVVMSAMVSSFFSGLFGSYTGVADPPLMIFALAMDVSVSVLRINYAVSSIVPAAMRAVVGIRDGFADKGLLVYYVVSVLFAWGGVAFGLHISHHNAVSHSTFMISTVATLLLVAFLMLVPIVDVFVRFGATAICFVIVAVAILRQQKKPEHRRPPAPPNTPATAAEVEAFEQYWLQRSHRQRSYLEFENEGSLYSMTPRSMSVAEESVRTCNSSSTTVPPSAEVPSTQPARKEKRPQQQQREAPVCSSRGVIAAEELPMRGGAEGEEELITIVPVHATSHV